MRWLTVRLRAGRIRKITESRLTEKYMRSLEPSDDNEWQAGLCVQFEMRRRKITVQDIKFIRYVKCHGVKGEFDLEQLRNELESTRIQRILGWEEDIK